MLVEETRRPIVLQPADGVKTWDRENRNFNIDGATTRALFVQFFRNFRIGNVFIYRDALVRNWNRREYFIEIELSHLNEFDEVLFNNLQTRPSDVLPFFESAAKDALRSSLTQENQDLLNNTPEFQILLRSIQFHLPLRNLTAEHMNKLIKVPGIIISCSKVKSKATLICLRCTKCQCVKKIPSKNAMAGVQLPTSCDRDGVPGEDCGPNPFIIMADHCEYIDQQIMKLQESPEDVPTGEMPRFITLSVDRYLVDKITPGTRVSIVGISSLFNSNVKSKINTSAALRTPYLRVCGIQIEFGGGGRTTNIFTPEEEEAMQRLARDPLIYEKLASSIAPQISGEYTKDIKKALACLLMSGSRKVMPDGVKLRGDINVLLMGDPSVAKSQFLKFIEKVAPIGVYTSGKGSSAAGLTAAVNKSNNGEFFLEGGAMVMADGGVICIDEFDKMREQDRVAIHEAMEQQTISIAKAGITTVLNCRASVLAAANPIFGRYDDLKSVSENIDLMSTILSRFDCIFIIRDVRDQERDKSIAQHVLGVHMTSSMTDTTTNAPEISATTLKKFITYCRERCAPRLNEEAAALLSGQYVHIRNSVRQMLQDRPDDEIVVPITIRQLEAIIRISESLAKMRLSAEATVVDVEEAIRLFKVSTLAASQTNSILSSGMSSTIATQDVARAEEFLKRRMGLRVLVNTKKLIEEAQIQGYSAEAIRVGIAMMIRKREIQETRQGKTLCRVL